MFAQFKLEVAERNHDVLIVDAVNAETADYINYYEFTKKNPNWTVSFFLNIIYIKSTIGVRSRTLYPVLPCQT